MLKRTFLKRVLPTIGATLGTALLVAPALAHVVVKPNEAKVAQFTTFSMGVPNEKDMPTVAVRVLIPAGLKFVSPNVKPGWTITEKKTGTGEDVSVTEISWTGGSIPVGQRDDFYFSAQVPASATTLAWKAYQTYQDGTIVNWNQDPATVKKGEEGTPYSTTKVVNDLSTNAPAATTTTETKTDSRPLMLSLVAIVLSLAALAVSFMRKGSVGSE